MHLIINLFLISYDIMKFFYKDLTLEVPESVYYPREDSLLLAKTLGNRHAGKVLDMGCGSGILSILLAKNNDVTAVDINKDAVKAAIDNAEKNKVSLKVMVSDLFVFIDDSYDLIVFNAPYLPVENEDKQWSGGIKLIEKFISQAKPHLNKRGKILLLISSLTGEKAVLSAFRDNGFSAQTIKREKVPWEELIVIEARN